MTSAALVTVPIASIIVGQRLRPVDPAAVANMMVAITESDFFGSILVRPLPSEEGEPLFELVAGAHRLAAMRQLGRPVIPATIRALSDDEALQIEIDENLVRRGLTPLERDEMVLARFAVWARRFPDRVVAQGDVQTPKRGRPKNSDNMSEFLNGVPQAMGFAAETAAEVGLHEKTIRRALATVRGIPAELRARLRHTWLAKNDAALRQLATIADPVEQGRVADLLLQGQAKNVSDARAIAAGVQPSAAVQTPLDETVKAFRALWGKATPSARAAILDDLAARKLPAGFSVTREGADG